jgi:hypothetical protein
LKGHFAAAIPPPPTSVSRLGHSPLKNESDLYLIAKSSEKKEVQEELHENNLNAERKAPLGGLASIAINPTMPFNQ